MQKIGSRDRVLAVLRQAEWALDDDEIGEAAHINRHYVNTLCRQLAAEGMLERHAGPDGKLVNSLANPGQAPALTEAPVAPRRRRTSRDRQDVRIAELIAGFSRFVTIFERSEAFPGPSLYFHDRAIRRRRAHSSAEDALSDELFLEYVYAVLPAWGMHRMGKQAAKVGDFTQIVTSLRSQRDVITELWPLRITEIDANHAHHVADLAWQVIAETHVSRSGTQIVAGSKWLHHLLPDLIPPIDRQYTFRFFTGQKAVNGGDRRAFLYWMPLFAEIGTACKAEIRTAIDSGGFMATGEAKVIDNAIMGFMQTQDRTTDAQTAAD